MIAWTPYDSSCLNLIGWELATLTLGVAFDFRGTYIYFEVPESVHDAFISASSKGKFFDASIRHAGYSYQKIAP
jgi:hypothetical protein